jgi:hypothetical protein
LPEKEELDRLLRYEAMINRQLDHAIAELERIQSHRMERRRRQPITLLRNKAKKVFDFSSKVS